MGVGELGILRGIEYFRLIACRIVDMKNLMRLTASLVIGAMCASCSTSYDSYGSRRQTVDPAGAAIGAVALGALAYSIGKDRGKEKEQRRNGRRDYYDYYDNDSRGFQDGYGYNQRRAQYGNYYRR